MREEDRKAGDRLSGEVGRPGGQGWLGWQGCGRPDPLEQGRETGGVQEGHLPRGVQAFSAVTAVNNASGLRGKRQMTLPWRIVLMLY